MEIRHFSESDVHELIRLFRDTVHSVCKNSYTPEQLAVWAPDNISTSEWSARFRVSFTLVAEIEGRIAGFANLENDGCIDMLYVASSKQGQGVASALYQGLEKEARKQKLERIFSDVSLTARQFFLSKGFVIEKEYSKRIANTKFPNAVMSKHLT